MSKQLWMAMLVFTGAWLAAPGLASAAISQEWDFHVAGTPSTPEHYTNLYGQPVAIIDYNPPYGTGWTYSSPAIYGDALGWWDIANGSIVLRIPENLSGSANLLQLKITYWRDISMAPSVSFAGTAAQQGNTITTLVAAGPVGGGWYQDASTWMIGTTSLVELTLHGNASWGSVIDQVSVTIPEPTTGVLVAATVLLLARRRHPYRFGRE